MLVNILGEEHLTDLEQFCINCRELGYNNNSSLDVMKYKWCKDWGQYWGAWHNNKLIAVAGAHPLPEVDSNAIRVLFRGCQIEEVYKGLCKYHMNSVGFRDILPYQIEKYADKDLFITTNIYKDNSGKMHKTHKAMHLLSKKGIVDLFIKDAVIYNTNQCVWRLNKEKYYEVRHRLETP